MLRNSCQWQSLDALFSEFIRRRAGWRCEKCGANHTCNREYLDCSHFHRRALKSTRFDPDNCSALCRGCHEYFDTHKADYAEWKMKRLGPERFCELNLRAQAVCKPDAGALRYWLRGEIEKFRRRNLVGFAGA